MPTACRRQSRKKKYRSSRSCRAHGSRLSLFIPSISFFFSQLFFIIFLLLSYCFFILSSTFLVSNPIISFETPKIIHPPPPLTPTGSTAPPPPKRSRGRPSKEAAQVQTVDVDASAPFQLGVGSLGVVDASASMRGAYDLAASAVDVDDAPNGCDFPSTAGALASETLHSGVGVLAASGGSALAGEVSGSAPSLSVHVEQQQSNDGISAGVEKDSVRIPVVESDLSYPAIVSSVAPGVAQRPAAEHPFYLSTEIDNQVAMSIREHCNMEALNQEHLQAAIVGLEVVEINGNDVLVDQYLHGPELFALLCLLAELSRRRVVVVSPSFSGYYLDPANANASNPNEEIRASGHAYGNTDTVEVVLIPVYVPGHWMLGIYEARTGSLYFYDSMQHPLEDRVRAVLRRAVLTLRPEGQPPLRTPRVLSRPHHTYNRQPDGVNCGFCARLYSELYLLHGLQGTFLHPFGVAEMFAERQRMTEQAIHLFQGSIPVYRPPPIPVPPVRAAPPIVETPSGSRRSERIQGIQERRRMEEQQQQQRVEEERRVQELERESLQQRRAPIASLEPITQRCYAKHLNMGCAAIAANHRWMYYESPGFDRRCPHCDAWLMSYQLTKLKCCSKGKVHLPDEWDALRERPLELEVMLGDENNAKKFRRESRMFNTELAFGSTTSHEEYLPPHGVPVCRVNGETSYNVSDLLPPRARPGQPPRAPLFGQHYVIDQDSSMMARMNNSPTLNENWIRILDGMLRDGPIAQNYKRGAERRAEGRQRNLEAGLPEPEFRLILLNDRQAGPAADPSLHPHQTLLPTADQVGVIWTSDDGEAPPHRGIWLSGKDGKVHKLQPWDPNLEPICFPLLFPRGQQGYRLGIPYRGVIPRINAPGEVADSQQLDDDTVLATVPGAEGRQVAQPRQFVSMREFWRNLMHLRGPSFSYADHWLWQMGRLAEYFVIELLNRVEFRETQMIQEKQGDMRWSLKDDFVAALEKGIPDGGKIGRYFAMPQSWVGSRRYMQDLYANIMTICHEKGRGPTFFVTFTGNPAWPEITKHLQPGQPYSELPTLVSDVYEDKIREFMKDLTERHVLGPMVAWVRVREYQKRAMQHDHILLWHEQTDDLDTPEFVDRYISAEIPELPAEDDKSEEANQMRRLHHVIVNHNLHHCTENTQCLVDGKCTKRFPKPFSAYTTLSPNQYPQYRRRHPDPKADGMAAENEGFEAEDAVPDAPDENEVEYRRRPPPPEDRPSDPATQYGQSYRKRVQHGVEVPLDNRHVVPYNGPMSLKYHTHINVEANDSKGCVSYVSKYVTKGTDLAYVRVEQKRRGPPGVQAQPEPSNADDSQPQSDSAPGQQLDGDTENPAGRAQPPQNTGGDQQPALYDYDEFAFTRKVVYRTANEAVDRLYGRTLASLSATVQVLYVHLPGQTGVIFEEGLEDEVNLGSAGEKVTPLSAYFELNRRALDTDSPAYDVRVENYRYNTIGQIYWFDTRKGQRRWVRRAPGYEKPLLLTRVGRVSPKNTELTAYRALLLTVPAPLSPEHLRTYEGTICSTFVECARRRGIFESSELWVNTIREMSVEMRSARKLRDNFATLMFNVAPTDPCEIFDQLLDLLCPLPVGSMDTVESRKQRALNDIEWVLRTHYNSSCLAIGLYGPENYNHEVMEQERERQDTYLPASVGEIGDTDGGNRSHSWSTLAQRNRAKLTEDEQLPILNRIVNAVEADPLDNGVHRYYFLEAPGGYGKSFLSNTIIADLLSRGIAIRVGASTGIASQLLIKGSTVHHKFWIPIDLDPKSPPTVEYQKDFAEQLRKVKFILIDEVTCLDRTVLEYLDRMLRDIAPAELREHPFGGKVVLLSGNWNQILPVVIGGGMHAQRDACFKSSPLYPLFKTLTLTKNQRVDPGEIEWASYLMRIGNGEENAADDTIEVPEANRASSMDDLIKHCFSDAALARPLEHAEELCGSAILAPTNKLAARINTRVNFRLPSEQRIYLGTDTIIGFSRTDMLRVNAQDTCLEQIHLETPNGLPPYELKLKLGSIIMLIKNFDIPNGLCNGTRLQIVGMLEHLLKCRILTGGRSRGDNYVFLPRIPFEYGNKKSDLRTAFRRIQFPVRLCFAMTVNKSQGQTLDKVGLALHEIQCKSHGQLYTAFSRVRNPKSLLVLCNGTRVLNTVDREVLRETLSAEVVSEEVEEELESEPMVDMDWA
jgi:hypothetical protein